MQRTDQTYCLERRPQNLHKFKPDNCNTTVQKKFKSDSTGLVRVPMDGTTADNQILNFDVLFRSEGNQKSYIEGSGHRM